MASRWEAVVDGGVGADGGGRLGGAGGALGREGVAVEVGAKSGGFFAPFPAIFLALECRRGVVVGGVLVFRSITEIDDVEAGEGVLPIGSEGLESPEDEGVGRREIGTTTDEGSAHVEAKVVGAIREGPQVVGVGGRRRGRAGLEEICEESAAAPKGTEGDDAAVGGDDVVVVGENVPEALAEQVGEFVFVGCWGGWRRGFRKLVGLFIADEFLEGGDGGFGFGGCQFGAETSHPLGELDVLVVALLGGGMKAAVERRGGPAVGAEFGEERGVRSPAGKRRAKMARASSLDSSSMMRGGWTSQSRVNGSGLGGWRLGVVSGEE